MKKRPSQLSQFTVFLLLILTLASSSHSASFDCKKAKSINEHLICEDEDLSKLDDELAFIYKEALRKSLNQKELTANQRDAWRHRENECSSKACLVEWFSQRKTYLSATNSQPTDQLSTAYLPWTLDVTGYESGKCTVTELARSFKEARGWASESSGWINIHSVIESPEKIIIAYYDGLLRAESIRTFYKDMKTCKIFRK